MYNVCDKKYCVKKCKWINRNKLILYTVRCKKYVQNILYDTKIILVARRMN